MIPAVLAIFGDNPMQSELACHVGLAGKFFCQNCWVKGRDTVGKEELADNDANSDSDSVCTASTQSEGSGQEELAPAPGRKKQKHKETMQELVDQAKRFLDVRVSLPSSHSLSDS